MMQGKQQQQEVEPQPAPWGGPEEPEPAFTTDEGAVPLSKALWSDAKETFTTGVSLLGNLKARSLNTENDLKQKFVGALLSHRVTQNIGTAAAAFLTPPEKFLTKDEYENSEYKRPGLNFNQGVYENLAKEEAVHFDQDQVFKDLNSRTAQGTWPTIAKGGAYLTGGFANPLFLLFGGVAGEALAPAVTFLGKFLPELKFLSSEVQAGVKAFTAKTFIRGGEMPVFTGLDYAEERAHQEDASIRNILYSIPVGMIFGAGEFGFGKVFGRGLSSRKPELKSDFAKEKGMNEPKEGESEPIVQEPAISPHAHEEAFKSGVAQMENGKLPEVSEIVKQNYHNDWQNNLGEKLREDPEGYVKELDDIKKSRDIVQEKLDDVNKYIETKEAQKLKFTVKPTQIDIVGIPKIGEIPLTEEQLKLSDPNKLFHGTDSASMLKILKSEEITPRISKLDKLKQKAISLTNNPAVATNFAGHYFEIDPKEIETFDVSKEIFGEDAKAGFELRTKEKIPIEKIKKITLVLGKEEDLDNSIYDDFGKKIATLEDIVEEATAHKIDVEIWHDNPEKITKGLEVLNKDRDTLLNKKAALDDMIATRENAPEASNMEDLANKIAKQHSPQSDFSYFEPKEPKNIPAEEKSVNDYSDKMTKDFNTKKAQMSPKVQDLADTEDIKTKSKGTRKMLNAIEACLRRGE